MVQRCPVPLPAPCLQEELWQTAAFHLERKNVVAVSSGPSRAVRAGEPRQGSLGADGEQQLPQITLP